MFNGKQREVYEYCYTSFFIMSMPDLETGKKVMKHEKTTESGRKNLTGHESLGHLKGSSRAAHDTEMKIKV